MLRRLALLAALATALPVAATGGAGALSPERAVTTEAPAWPDTDVSRLTALALIQSLNAALLSGPSATLTLDRWCADHALAPAPAKIIAERATDIDKPDDAKTRALLEVGPDEAVAYRRVRLQCGTLVLTEADNWYVPSRLTEAMNQTLLTTNTSFGRVVAPLGFTRTTVEATLLWQPLPEDWATDPVQASPASSGALAIPPELLRHRAVLKRADGKPFSVVVETYTSAVLAFPAPVIGTPANR